MKASIKHIFLCLALISFASCAKENLEDSNLIRLQAGVGHAPVKGTTTDDSGIRDYNYPGTFDIGLMRIDENLVGGTYPWFKDTGTTAIKATVGEPSADDYMRDIEFEYSQYYRNNTDKVRYASWYPYESATIASNADSTTISFDVDGKTDIMYGTIAEGQKLAGGFNPISFNHALTQFNIYAYQMSDDGESQGGNGDGDASVDWGYVTDLIINEVKTKCNITLPKSGDGLNYTLSYTGDEQEIDIKTTEGIYWNPGDASNKIPGGFNNKKKIAQFLAPPPARGYVNLKISTSSTGSTYQQVSIARNFKPGCSYDVVLRFTSHGIINSEVSVGEWTYEKPNGQDIVQDVAADMYYDLSAYRCSNCYVIPSGNYGYSFKGTVKGNSTEALNPGYIDILWCDNPNIWTAAKNDNGLAYCDDKGNLLGGNYLQLASHTLSMNRVMLKVGYIKDDNDKTLKYKGNAVIAAYDKKGGSIIWTWHLWFNSKLSNIGYMHGYSALNMLLGATSEEGEGLYYQWGRKDPFTPNVPFTVESSAASVEQTIANPTTFYSGTDTWYSGTQSDMSGFWGWTNERTDIKKSKYDPCPAGYFVSDYRFWSTNQVAEHEVSYSAGDKATVEVANRAAVFNLSQGYLDASGQKSTTIPMFTWSSSFDKNGTNPYVMTYSQSYETSPANSSVATVDQHRNYGGSVRCLSKSASVVKDLSTPQCANCYVISSDGFYKFRANVAGNGTSTLITNKGNEWDISGGKWGDGQAVCDNGAVNPDHIEYLWYQPELTGTLPESVTTNDICLKIVDNGALDDQGYATIEVVGWKPGNVIVAAYSGTTIVWSWHFWLTDEPQDVAFSSHTLLDRNVGATKAGSSSTGTDDLLATYGFLYQWGRKDPFPGPATYNAGSAANTVCSPWFKYSGGSWAKRSSIDVLAGPVSLKNAAENPDRFITSSTGTDPAIHWMANFDKSVDAMKALWGYSIEGNDRGIEPGKTLYDPCPAGYKLGTHFVFWGGDSPTYPGVTGSGYGYIFSSFSSTCWFPKNGQRSNTDGSIQNAGTYSYIYNSVPYSGGARYIGLTGYGYSGSNPDAGANPSIAMGVRCKKQ